MAKIVVLGVTGEPGLWLVDLEAGAVTPADAAALSGTGAIGDDLAAAVTAARASGHTTIKGVDLAIAADNRSAAASHQSVT